MISEFFINIIFGLVMGFFEILPDFDLSAAMESAEFETFTDIISMACYLLPMDTVGAIIAIVYLLSCFRIVVAIIKSIWDLLPFA